MSLNHTYLRFSEIDKSWQEKQVLRQLDIAVESGSCLLITGENGSGKSTLLRIMSGLLKPDHFKLASDGNQIGWRKFQKVIRQHIMYLHQTPYLFDCTVEKNLKYVASNRNINEVMHWADIRHIAQQKARGLSGGEAQRVALARAWLKQPRVLLLDEPTANLDADSRGRTVEMLRQFKAHGMAIVIASHDPMHFMKVVDRQYHLVNGAMTEPSCEDANNLVTLRPRKIPASIDTDMATAS